jgi:hypothetical protein
MVTIIFIEPRREDVIRKIIPQSHIVCPDSKIDNGGYEVQPLLAAPSGVKKLAIIITPPIKYDQ